ncbi:hypothetical protein ACVI1L_000120 [Bradyrhizobium sp. USDA 4516]
MAGRGDLPARCRMEVACRRSLGLSAFSRYHLQNATSWSKIRLLTIRTGFAPITTRTKGGERGRIRRKGRKLNSGDDCPTAHNGLVAGSSPAGPTNEINRLTSFSLPAARRPHQKPHQIRAVFVHTKVRNGVRQAHLLMSERDSAIHDPRLRPTERHRQKQSLPLAVKSAISGKAEVSHNANQVR